MDTPCTAFIGPDILASGAPLDVALAVRAAIDADSAAAILVFDDDTGRAVDFDLRGDAADITERLSPPRGPGRPKLGVVAREVTLLPRHWDWLSTQRGGASVVLRRLVDEARKADAGPTLKRQAQDAAYRFMSAMSGNEPGFEEASRALFAQDRARFETLTAQWPDDVRDHARRMAAPALGGA